MKNVVQASNRMLGIRFWLARVSLGLLLLLVLLAGGTLTASAKARADLRAANPPVGQLVDIGGYSLHLHCMGSGSPTVVLDSGNGGLGLGWSLVQPEIARATRACVYDRAGYGWSNASPRPRAPGVMAEELYSLLNKAGIAGPYVLVGHSYGGLVIRQFASRHAAEVAGMVLVDSAHEEQFARFPADVRKLYESMLAPFRVMSLVGRSGVMALNPAAMPPDPRYPPAAAVAMRALIVANSEHVATLLAEVEGLLTSAPSAPQQLGSMPLVVLSHGRLDPAALPAGTPDAVRAAYEQLWHALQAELASLSNVSRHSVVPESGHDIHADAPAAVINAIHEVLATAARQP